jgi:hypothetical protein
MGGLHRGTLDVCAQRTALASTRPCQLKTRRYPSRTPVVTVSQLYYVVP